ncbi:MAG: cyclic pyranopterin monophosphate synthase MoaC [Actinomycetota bacterium]
MARIVEVGDKESTEREAVAECSISMTPDACARLVAGTRKGDPIEAARIAGLMATKRTPDLLPFCHPIAITSAEVLVEPDTDAGSIRVQATVRARDRTGVEMEALTAGAVAALCLYDTAKPYDRAAVISGLRLLEKSGGKSGDYRAL